MKKEHYEQIINGFHPDQTEGILEIEEIFDNQIIEIQNKYEISEMRLTNTIEDISGKGYHRQYEFHIISRPVSAKELKESKSQIKQIERGLN